MSLTDAQWVAVWPVPPVFMVGPFLLDGVASWMGWVDVVLTFAFVLLIIGAVFSRCARWLLLFVGLVLLVFYVLGLLKAFGQRPFESLAVT